MNFNLLYGLQQLLKIKKQITMILIYLLCQKHPSLPTISFIVKLSGSFYSTHLQSDLCVRELCPDLICVRFKGHCERKWLSGL